MPNGVVIVEKGTPMPELDADGELLNITEEDFSTLLENIESDFTAVMQETPYGSEMLSYVEKSKMTAANANAKSCHTSAMVVLTQAVVGGKKFGGSEISNSGGTILNDGGTMFRFGDTDVDCSDYLGESFTGYVYGEFDFDDCSVDFMLWSEEPIPDSMKHMITADEQQEYAEQGIYIGCYPIPM